MVKDNYHSQSDEVSPEDRFASDSRRGFLKATGVALASVTAPVGAAAAQQGTQGVDPSNRESVVEFVKRLDAASRVEAQQMWLDLPEEKAEALAQAIDEYSEVRKGKAVLVARDSDGDVIERKVSQPDGSQGGVQSTATTGQLDRSLQVSDDAAAQAQSYSYSDTRYRPLGPVDVYKMNATLNWQVLSQDAVPSGSSSSGAGLVPYWSDIAQESSTVSTPGNQAQTTQEREYEHDNPATTTQYIFQMVLQGSPNGAGSTVSVDRDA